MRKINCEAIAERSLELTRVMPKRGTLVIITVGDDPASLSYVAGKMKDCERCNVAYKWYKYDQKESWVTILNTINDCNEDDFVAGIILQLPTPYGDDVENMLINSIDPNKDVDGFTHESRFKPCTPEAVIKIAKETLDYENMTLDGANVLLVGRGKLVGKPLIQMLIDENATLTVAHSHTRDLFRHLNDVKYDVIILATNQIGEYDANCVDAMVIIDVGIGRDDDGKLCGNLKRPNENDGGKCNYYTPVPKGVGLVTRAMLLEHMRWTGNE